MFFLVQYSPDDTLDLYRGGGGLFFILGGPGGGGFLTDAPVKLHVSEGCLPLIRENGLTLNVYETSRSNPKPNPEPIGPALTPTLSQSDQP